MQAMKYKKTYIKIRIFIYLLAGLCILTACSNDSEPVSTEEPGGGVDPGSSKIRTAYVSVVINTLSEQIVRSNPSGGEEGDGSENAFENEDQINNLTLVFFTGADLNSSLNDTIKEIIYLGANQILPGNVTRVQKIELEKEIYNLLLLTNTGNISSQLRGKTVQELCDYVQTQAWTLSGGVYSNFVMTSAAQEQVDLIQPTSESSPAVARVDVQRIASRIDVLSNQGSNGTNTYPIQDGNQVIARVTLNRVRLMNRLTAGAYLIKRTAATVTDTPEYLGAETPQSGNQTNYVIDPWTSLKTADHLTGGYFNPGTGGTGTSPATDLYADYFTETTFSDADAIRAPLSGKDYYILGYTLENTMDKDSQLNGYTTGVMYETTYVPTQITGYNPSNLSNEVLNNTDAITFFTLNNNQSVYNSLESVAFSSFSEAQPDDFFSYTFTPSNTWQEVSDYADRINNNDILGFKSYLTGLLSGKILTDNLDQNLSWSAYLLETYGYSSQNGIVINQGGKNTIRLLTARGIGAYENGLNYYPYWIRHSNDNTIQSAVMEFGIVRNNIYKLRVLSFSGLGKPEPYDPDTDNPENPDEESHIRVLIWVRPWYLILHPEIVL